MPNESAFDHPIHKVWIMLDQAYVAASRCQEAVFTKAGLTLQQYRVLMVIDAAKNPVKPTDVARRLNRNTNSISLIIDRMEKVDLVERVRDLKDRRALRLVMTAKGMELFKRATVRGLELIKTMTSCCTEGEMQVLSNLLGRLREETDRAARINGS